MAAHVELSFIRRNAWPAGARFHVLWNGIVAANGDGIPNGDPGADVDETAPLTPSPIDVWPAGKAGIGDEPVADGTVGEVANYGRGFGAGDGAVGEGEAGLYADRLSWSTRTVLPALRDGTYKFAIRIEDELGNVQSQPLSVQTVIIRSVPRAPSDLRYAGFSGGELQLAWRHSPDLA